VPHRSERVRVAWIDTDAGGRFHFTAAFRWVEAAEMGLYRELGLLEDVGSLPRRHAEVEFRRPLRFDDEVEVELDVDRVGRTSVTYRWRILHAGAVAVEGRHTVVHVDPEGLPSPLGGEMRRRLAGLPGA
jgi:acyl-CoA thioester hydrolase